MWRRLELRNPDVCQDSSASVWAAFGINARLGQAQALDGSTRHQVLLHDLRSVGRLHVAVPDCLRVDHDDRTVLALIETERLVDAHRGAQSCGL